MSPLTLSKRQDPDGDWDGPAARRERRRRRLVSSAAFLTAVGALAAAAFAWSVQLGLAGAVGIGAHLPLG